MEHKKFQKDCGGEKIYIKKQYYGKYFSSRLINHQRGGYEYNEIKKMLMALQLNSFYCLEIKKKNGERRKEIVCWRKLRLGKFFHGLR